MKNMLVFISNYDSWFWLAVLIVCCILEFFSLGLTTIWAAIAALPMIFIARTNLDFRWQLIVFVSLTLLLLIFTRPFAVKKLKNGSLKTNVDSMIGSQVLVTEKISGFEKGSVKTKNGVIWSASAAENSVEISEGSLCNVCEVKGNTLIVSL